MDPMMMTVAIMSIGLLTLFALSVPVYVSFLLCNLAAVFLLMGPNGFGMFVNSLASTSTSSTLLALPAFILMGEILYLGECDRPSDRRISRTPLCARHNSVNNPCNLVRLGHGQCRDAVALGLSRDAQTGL